VIDHLQACGHCPKYDGEKCLVYYRLDWVNRRGGCPMFPHRDLPEGRRKRMGQQKQKHQDRAYGSKNDGRRKFKSVY